MVVVAGNVSTVTAPSAPTVVVVIEELPAAGADAACATVADRPATPAAADAKTTLTVRRFILQRPLDAV
jgi:hypothetical protein